MKDYQSPNKELIQDIVAIEWEMFTNVHNVGGPADCQSDPDQFQVMRTCTYLTWPRELLESYKQDLLAAHNEHTNLMAEKYARMMEVTEPGAIDMPPISGEQRDLMQEAMSIIIPWEDEMYERFPMLGGRARDLHQETVDAGSVSFTAFDTYQYGEMSIYSLNTLRLYVDFLRGQRDAGTNGSYLIYENMAKLRGWDSFEAANEAYVQGKMGR